VQNLRHLLRQGRGAANWGSSLLADSDSNRMLRRSRRLRRGRNGAPIRCNQTPTKSATKPCTVKMEADQLLEVRMLLPREKSQIMNSR
jgi:hypothetical protein